MTTTTTTTTQTISTSHEDKVRDVFEPPDQRNKNDWRRYIYVWIYYTVYEELQCRDLDRAVAVYETCLKVIPHRTFSFAKIWILLAQLLVRRHELQSANQYPDDVDSADATAGTQANAFKMLEMAARWKEQQQKGGDDEDDSDDDDADDSD
jgi:hypothetical protein